MDGRLTGRVMARPVRIGMVFKPSADMLRFAVEQATLLWGGKYQPFFRPGDLEQIEWVSRALGVDALIALDREAGSEQAAHLDGYQWQGREGWSPLAPAQDYVNHRLLGPERLLDELPRHWVLPGWAPDDPLDGLFRVWFGAHGTSDQGTSLRERFAAGAVEPRIDEGADVPAGAASWVTPIAVTGAAIDYAGESAGAAFVVVDPLDPASLAALWNARACGARVCPIPVGYEDRVVVAARAWLAQVRESGGLGRGRTGDGRPAGLRIYVWLAAGLGGLPPVLEDLLAGAGVTPMVLSRDEGLGLASGWHGDHPLTTTYVHSFSQPLEAEGRVARIPVPGVGIPARNGGVPQGDVLAVQMAISAGTGVRPDWTFRIPNKRSYARMLREYDDVLLSFDRPVSEGRVLSASVGAREVLISAVPSIRVLGELAGKPGWSAQQTPGGVFVTRFIDRLGGTGSTVANQPGARAALTEVTRSERGLLSSAIVEAVRKRQGSWPDPLTGNASGYPAAVFQFLLRQGILRPVLPVSCPHCTSSVAFRPEDLMTQMRCEMCLREFPLGLALGMKPNGRNDWLYQLAGHVGHDRLSEALPVMATLQVLCSLHYFRGHMTPYVLGWDVKGPKLKCEVDIAAFLDYCGLPAVVIGEVKSWQGSIDANDLNNLGRIQRHIREQGVECFVLAAVMRELRDEEISALREFAQRPPRTLPAHSAIEPVLPIVLTERTLSATRFEHLHPGSWRADGLVGLATESCRQNLGMIGLEPDHDGDGFYLRPQWTPADPATPADSRITPDAG